MLDTARFSCNCRYKHKHGRALFQEDMKFQDRELVGAVRFTAGKLRYLAMYPPQSICCFVIFQDYYLQSMDPALSESCTIFITPTSANR